MAANPIATSSVENLSGASSMVDADYSSADYTFPVIPRAIHVNAAGTAVVTLEGEISSVTHALVLNAGQTYPYRVKTIKNSGTTAGMGIRGIY
ncbi:hypothetical protein GOZ96_04805 [Agrobacterium vitis]|uniref:Uncharacterized protein n=1 Tax=Agrobacterium vitis TaxID=373 RepID=A0A7J4X4H2_AGRVI|nr:hypothetical protein [Agrobacterium vitis]KAA3527061.1 hypothetical protein DXT89_14095 [Agrobacterium vitis]MUZ95909.1 hypothetical protein [Agrobacterium vitis]